MAAIGGTAAYTYSVTSGALPSGLTLNASSGAIVGPPTSGGNFNLTITATDSSTGNGAPFTASKAYTLSIGAPTVAITPASLPAATVATAYNQTITASGGTAPYTYAVTAGSLPAGLTLSPAGVLSGTPTANGTSNVIMINHLRAGPNSRDMRGCWALGLPGVSYTANHAVGDAYGPNDTGCCSDDLAYCTDRPDIAMGCWGGGWYSKAGWSLVGPARPTPGKLS